MAAIGRRSILFGGALLAAGGAVGYRTFTQSRALATRRAAERAVLSFAPALADLVRYATLAPSGHNAQPWAFVASTGALTIRPDPLRQTPVVDPDDHHLYASLGCAAETLRIAARARGLGGQVSIDQTAIPEILVDLSPGPPEADATFDAIPVRQTTRSLFDASPVATEFVDQMIAAAMRAGADAMWIDAPDRVAAIAELVVSANNVQLESDRFREELKSWLRFSRAAALRTGDGLYAAATGNPVLPDALGRIAYDIVLEAEAEAQKYSAQIASSSGLMLLVSRSDDPAGWIGAGRACQAAMLAATAMELKSAFINQPLEVPAMRGELASYLGLDSGRPSLLLRIGRAETMPYSVRRPVAEVLSI